MNVAIFTDTFLPKIDGIVSSIVNTASELLDRGHRVMAVAPRIRKNQEDYIRQREPRLEILLIPGVNAMFYPDYRVTFPWTPMIINRLKKFNAHIVHFHTPFTIGLESILAAKILNLPLAGTFHTFFIEPEYLKIVKLHWVPGLVHFGWFYSNFFHDRCDMTVSPSQFTADELKRKKMKGPLMVISNGIPKRTPHNLSPEDKKQIRSKFGLKDKVMLFVGRVSEEKCIDVLIDSAKIVFQNRNDASLLIVGGGPALDRINKRIASEGLEENVITTGPIPHHQLMDSMLYEVSSFFVTASTSENQPMTIIEACMLGLPVLGVNAKGVPEMIDGNGFVAEPGNALEMASHMEKLLSDDSLRERFSCRSLQLGEGYDIKITTDKMLEMYEGIIRQKSKAPAEAAMPETY